MNLFATVLTYPAPSANYRGESELNRTVIQKVTGTDNQDYPIFSPESMRNALREVLRGYGLPANRERLHNEDQLAVRFSDLPDTDKYADDFFFGYLVAVDGKKRKEYEAKVAERGEEAAKRFTFKRDSILRMNLARALHPYRHNAVFTQSPLAAKESAYQNATTSALLHRETVVAGFQYPFALNLDDCKPKSGWTRKLLQAIGELNDVAGNHARSYFECRTYFHATVHGCDSTVQVRVIGTKVGTFDIKVDTSVCLGAELPFNGFLLKPGDSKTYFLTAKTG